MKKLLERIYNALPLYSWNAVERANGAGFTDGYILGAKEVGLTRDYRGRFVSLKPKRNYGTLHLNDECLSSRELTESPRKSSSCPD